MSRRRCITSVPEEVLAVALLADTVLEEILPSTGHPQKQKKELLCEQKNMLQDQLNVIDQQLEGL